MLNKGARIMNGEAQKEVKTLRSSLLKSKAVYENPPTQGAKRNNIISKILGVDGC